MNNKAIAQKLIELANELDPETLQGRGQIAPTLWEIKIKKGQTIESTLEECKKLFPVWRWTDDNLDQIMNSERTSKKAYTVKVLANIEADENLKNKSANDLEKEGIKGITLLERLQLEIDYFKETGKHLDIDNWTLCSGSRNSDGSVPHVNWNDVKLYVSWCHVDGADDDLRAREIQD
jgi:hypothetical protein